MKGTHTGFNFPASKLATCEARRPSTWSCASTTYHRRLTSLPLGKYVGMTRPLQWAQPPKIAKCRKYLMPISLSRETYGGITKIHKDLHGTEGGWLGRKSARRHRF